MTLITKKKIAGSVAVLALLSAAGIAQADVTNGNFTGGVSGSNALLNNPTYSNGSETTLTGWSSEGYSFVYTNPSDNNRGVSLIGVTAPNNPASTNFVAIDPVYQAPGAISQTLSLGAGTYAVTFEWAAAQQSGFSGATTEFWTVDFGAASQSTSTYHLASHAFSGWMSQTFDFVVTGGSETLSFLAGGGPSSTQPPFDLLADVRLTQVTVPEPASIAMFGAGLAGIAGFAAMRRRKNKKS